MERGKAESTTTTEHHERGAPCLRKFSNRKANLGFVWVKAVDSGNTYLCPASSVAGLQAASDVALSEIGMDESRNPHND